MTHRHVGVAAVTCGAFSVGLQGAARGDWAWRTCELVTVTSKETLFNDDPSYRCYVNYSKFRVVPIVLSKIPTWSGGTGKIFNALCQYSLRVR